MPTYDYRCNACGVRFELFQSMTEAHKKKCPECGKNKLERLIGPGAGFIFKGAGFYETDYRSSSYEEGAKAEASGGSNATPASDGASSESKPASKTDAESGSSARQSKTPTPGTAKKSAAGSRPSRARPAPPSASKSNKGGASKGRGRSKS
jgi:putative FmdB family regulatory protein